MDDDGQILVNIGFDSVDTPYGGCTTHFASLLLLRWVNNKRFQPVDYPNIIRLNPGIPWKTRGNGAVVLRFNTSSIDEAIDFFEDAVSFIDTYLREFSVNWERYSNPAIIMYMGEPDNLVKWFSIKAMQDIIPLDLLHRFLPRIKGVVKTWFKGNGRGLIGCLSGIGYRMIDTDYTYELIAYRSPENIGETRRVDAKSIIEMDMKFGSDTILNYDYEVDRPLITPHGPDPILFGIRGENPDVLLEAYKMIIVEEDNPLTVIFRTNQHTDAHLREINDLSEAYPYRSVKVKVIVSSKPRRVMGGHVMFKVSDGVREINVATYQPTGGFRNIVEKLEAGDVVEVMGVVRPFSSMHGNTINLEKLHVVEVKPRIITENPYCPRCGSRLKSAGRGKGFKCDKCGFKTKDLNKKITVVKPDLEPGWYEPPPRVFKHLMKPIKRFGREKKSFTVKYTPRNYIILNREVYV